MVYTDGAHLIADSLDELHNFAIRKLGFKKEWFQNECKIKHYDLTTINATKRAIKAGAKFVSKKELIKLIYEEKGI